MWKGVINQFKKRLAVWKGRNLTMAGRVTLINSVLNAIPIYSFSFYKAPSKVVQEIRSIQSSFLWSGSENKRKVHWVSWKTVCDKREKGGLGVKDVEAQNLALLNKWKWRVVNEKDAVWQNILRSRYGNLVVKVLLGEESVLYQRDSIWWRDLVTTDKSICSLNYCFAGEVSCGVHNGIGIPFWLSKWLGNQKLAEAFPEIFDLAINANCSVAEAGAWSNGEWTWNLSALVDNRDCIDTILWEEFELAVQQAHMNL